MLKKILITSIPFLLLEFIISVYGAEGPVHDPEYYAGITLHILSDRDLIESHEKNAEHALGYIENPRVSRRVKMGLIEKIFLGREFKQFQMRAASAGVALLTEGILNDQEKAFIALQLFTNQSLGQYYEHEAAIEAWKQFSQSTHPSMALAKEVIACHLLRCKKFQSHHKFAISVWKSLDITAKAFTACDILKESSLSRCHAYAERSLREFFSSNDEIAPWYQKARLLKIIKQTKASQLINARAIALDYFNSLEDDADVQEKQARKRRRAS